MSFSVCRELLKRASNIRASLGNALPVAEFIQKLEDSPVLIIELRNMYAIVAAPLKSLQCHNLVILIGT
jgi:hypothetical protein